MQDISKISPQFVGISLGVFANQNNSIQMYTTLQSLKIQKTSI